MDHHQQHCYHNSKNPPPLPPQQQQPNTTTTTTATTQHHHYHHNSNNPTPLPPQQQQPNTTTTTATQHHYHHHNSNIPKNKLIRFFCFVLFFNFHASSTASGQLLTRPELKRTPHDSNTNTPCRFRQAAKQKGLYDGGEGVDEREGRRNEGKRGIQKKHLADRDEPSPVSSLLPSLSVLTRRIILAKGKRGEIRKADDSTEAVSGFHRSDVQKERKSNLYSAPVMASP